MAKNLFNLATDTHLQIQEADWTPAGYIQNYSHQEIIIIKFKKQGQRKLQSERANVLHLQHQFICQWILLLKPWKPERSGTVFFKWWKKRAFKYEFNIWRNNLSFRNEGEIRHSQMKENGKDLYPTDLPV